MLERGFLGCCLEFETSFCIRLERRCGKSVDLHSLQSRAQLLALGEGRGPVAVVAVTVEAQALAGEQTVGDHGDGYL
jgi:hypothetical protein